jgi:hypothetical protein
MLSMIEPTPRPTPEAAWPLADTIPLKDRVMLAVAEPTAVASWAAAAPAA